MDYKPSGVCSRLIHVELDGDKIANVEFVGGCAGNTAGISSLVKGMDAHEVIKRLEGTKCGARPTSCPDQLSKALKQLRLLITIVTFLIVFRSLVLMHYLSFICFMDICLY